MAFSVRSVRVPHLGGVVASYALSRPFDPKKPTIVLLHPFALNARFYGPQFSDPELLFEANLLAVELMGHGATRAAKAGHWTYWDSAVVAVQVMDALRVDKAFALGTGQGGWVAVRMALIAPERILGVIPIGTSMDHESRRSRDLGCWDAAPAVASALRLCASPAAPTPDFAPPDEFCSEIVAMGMGSAGPEASEYWTEQIGLCYAGDAGRERLRISTVCLAERDGLHLRLPDVRCPVLWMHGTEDKVYSLANALEETKLFTGSPSVRLEIIHNGQHFLSATHPKSVRAWLVRFITRYAGWEP